MISSRLITIAICTWNRADSLGSTLAALGDLTVPKGIDWELLIVNNNCRDHTDEVIRSHEGRLPISRLFEPRQGLSNSRNCAVGAACGDLLLWTDDDITVEPGWLAAYAAGAERWPDAAFFGGPIEPNWSCDPPAWLRDAWPRVGTWYGMVDFGNHSLEYDAEHLPFGGNYAMRMDVQRRYPYDPDLGVKGKSMLSGEETTLFRRMLADGHRGCYVPDARVAHYIPQRYQTLGYLRRRSFAYGRQLAVIERQEGRRPSWRGRYELFRRAVKIELRYRAARRSQAPDAWLPDLELASLFWGRLLG